MSNIRVHDLAKELNISNKELISKLNEMGAEIKSHMSGVDAEMEKKVRGIYAPKPEKTKTVEKSKDNTAETVKPRENRKNEESGRERASENRRPRENRPPREGKRPPEGRRPQGRRTDENRRPSDERRSDERRSDDRRSDERRNGERRNGERRFDDRRSDDRRSDERRSDDRRSDDRRSDDRRRDDRRSEGRRSDRRNDSRLRDGDRPEDNRKQKDADRYQENRRQKEAEKQRENKRQDNKKSREAAEQNERSFLNKQAKNESKKNKNKKDKKAAQPEAVQAQEAPEEDIQLIQIYDTITVKELAEKIKKAPSELVMRLMKKGVMAAINNEIDFETAEALCEEFDIIVEKAQEVDILEEAFAEEEDSPEDLKERPPVVVVMGHVDHGKTSLLDSIRHSKVTSQEAGGITQHIGAYTVSINNKPITFLDTPGHEAFTAMRMRGAQVTDIAILVVAADDGVMPQTVEAINHAKAAGVEIIVAINKIDKPSANPDRVKQELVEYGLISEDWGGDTICVPVSAVSKEGIDQLLEMILLVAEMKELKANPDKRARGSIIEAQLDKGRGSVATVLVQDGTLNVGDPVVAGGTYGKIRAMMNDKGQKVKSAGPSVPVEILGLNEVPGAGDMFYVAKSEKHARQISEAIVAKGREELIKQTPQKVSLDDLFSQIQSGNIKELNIVIKADVQGSVEAVRSSLEKLSNDEVRIRTIHGGVGAVTESDVMLASASNAIIIGFNVRPEASAKNVADDQKVDIRLYRVIYNAIEDITAAMKGMLDPVYEEKIIGHAEIRQLFKASGVGTIGGSYVTDGKFVRNAKVRIIRNGIVVYEGELATLRRFKDDVKEVNAGYECGLLFNKFNDIKEGDIVEAYIMEEVKH